MATAYATATEFKAAFPADESVVLTNLDDPTAASADDTRITEALTRAQSEMDSYIGITTSLPLSSVPLVVKAKCLDIARYYLDSYQPREDVRQRYEDAVKWLERLAKGQATLGLDSSDTDFSNTALPTYYAQDRVFTLGTDGTLAGY